MYVSNEDSGDVSVIDPRSGRVLHTIAVGKRPRGLRLSHDEKTLLVAVSGSPKAPPGTDESNLPSPDHRSDGIAVVDLSTGRVVQTLDSGSDPESFDLSSDGRTIYVSNEDTARTSVVDVATGKLLHSITVGREPEGVGTCPDGSCVLVTSEGDAEVALIETTSHQVVARIETGRRPRSVAFSADGKLAYVSNEMSASLSVLDLAARKLVRTIALGDESIRPMGLAMSADGASLYVTTGRGGGVLTVDVSSHTIRSRLPDVGKRPWGIGLDDVRHKLYTANGPSHDVSVIDLTTHQVERRIPVGRSPWGIAVARGLNTEQTHADIQPVRDRVVSELEQRTLDDTSWVMPAKNYQNTRFSPLHQIDVSNASKLEVKWGYATGISKGHEAAPLVVDGIMYLVTPFPNRLVALDLHKTPVTELWTYDPRQNRAAQGVACCDVVNRGAVFAQGKVIFNTLDNHTIAVDARTGQEVWRSKLGETSRGESMTMAPLVVRDKVLVGNSGGEFGVRGWLSALDLESGQLVWRAYSTGPDYEVLIGPSFKPFYTSDRGVDLGVRSWPAGKWQQGGGTVWGFVSYDPTLDLIFYGTGNPGPWNPEQREGDNKWTCGVFARRPDSGEAVWFYQWTPHDSHDYDGINENVVVDMKLDGKDRQVLLHVDRTGYVYVLDRSRGEVLSATPFTHITTSHGVDLSTGRLHEATERSVGNGRITLDICPASPGGKDWQPTAYDASRGLLYIPANNLCEDTQGYEPSYIAGTPYVGTNTRMYAGPGGHRGELIAWDVAKKQARFRIKEEYPVWSGVLATGGDVVFYGTMDGWFKAIEASSGKELWKQQLGSGVIGQPATFVGPDGKQYVSVFAGVGGWSGAVVSGDLDRKDTTAALGFVGAMGDLKDRVNKGGTLYTFGLP